MMVGAGSWLGRRTLRVEVVTTLNGFDALESAWRELARGSDFPMQQFEWCRAQIEPLGAARKLRVLVARQGERVRAIFPLQIDRNPGDPCSHLRPMGVRELSEPVDLLADGVSSRRAIVAAALRRGYPVLMDRLWVDSSTIQDLDTHAGLRGIVRREVGKSCPFIELSPAWLEPEAQLSAGRRSDFRRAQRRAQQLGAPIVEILTPSAAQVDSLLEQALEIESRSWKGETGDAMKYDPRCGGFFRSYARRAASAGILRLCFLRLGERPAAMTLAVEHANRFWVLKVGYDGFDAEVARCSPGILLMRETIKYAAERGLLSYELLGTQADWIRVWTQRERETVRVAAYPTCVRSGLNLAAKAARRVAGRARGLIEKRRGGAKSGASIPLNPTDRAA